MQRLLSFSMLCSLCLLSLPSLAQAQTPSVSAPTAITILLLPGTGDPLTLAPINSFTTAIGATQNCGIDPASIAPPPTAPVVNPLLYTLEDPFTAGRRCRLGFPTGLPAGSYQWAGVFNAMCVPNTGGSPVPCTGPRAVGQPPFSVVNPVLPPGAPMGLTFTQ